MVEEELPPTTYILVYRCNYYGITTTFFDVVTMLETQMVIEGLCRPRKNIG